MLLNKWHTTVRLGGGILDNGSGIVEGASHTLKESGTGLDDLVGRIIGFLGRL